MAKRVFVYDGREFPDPDPNMSTDAVRQYLAVMMPELSNAEANTTKRGEDAVTEFKKRVGTKGIQNSHLEGD
jgi:PRTRC genetic system protein C